MPKGSVELTNARREEIVDACAELYRTRPFREITIKEIGEKTSVTRTSIYNYFQTKEEIFLALLQREYQAWGDELDALPPGPMSAGQLADALARTLERRTCMLKLMAMNLYDIETNSRLENLAAFKRTLPPRPAGGGTAAVSVCVFPVPVRRLPLHHRHQKAEAGDGAGPCGGPAPVGLRADLRLCTAAAAGHARMTLPCGRSAAGPRPAGEETPPRGALFVWPGGGGVLMIR